MIQANELRIGNWVSYKRKKAVINEIDKHVLEVDFNGKRIASLAKNFHPIPLTPELLEKAGFRIVNHIGGYSFYTLDRKGKNRENPPIDIYENRTLHNNYPVKHCKYLHQLQNLFWCLTGKELTINH